MRRLPTVLSAFSLLLCGAAGVMGWRSWRHAATDEDRISWLTSGGDRMTIRSDAGRVTLFEPPAGNPDAVAQLPKVPSTQPTSFAGWPQMPRRSAFTDPRFRVFERARDVSLPVLRDAVAALRSDQVEWFVRWREQAAATRPTVRDCCCAAQIGSPAFLLSPHDQFELGLSALTPWTDIPPAFQSADAIPSLLPALEDPQRFAVAHLLLRHLYPQPTPMPGGYRFDLMNGDYEVDGLNVQLSEGKLLWDDYMIVRDGVASIDPAQLPRIRDQWHRRLDVAKAAAPWWAITATLALMPLLSLAAFVRRALRRRQRQSRGLCRVCGYDLRASGGRCPECGRSASGVPMYCET